MQDERVVSAGRRPRSSGAAEGGERVRRVLLRLRLRAGVQGAHDQGEVRRSIEIGSVGRTSGSFQAHFSGDSGGAPNPEEKRESRLDEEARERIR